MPSPSAEVGDFEKLSQAFATLTHNFGSFENLLEAFGLAHMPAAQRYGIFFGFVVFTLTICAVMTLLVMGGSFQRIAIQAKRNAEAATGGEVTVPDIVSARQGRPLLYERLLESRDRMIGDYQPPKTTAEWTPLTKKMLNVPIPTGNVADLADEDSSKRSKQSNNVPEGYLQNYVEAYRKCQDKPYGPALSGFPEARYEAYARAFAGCGIHTDRNYRRSYARLYEQLCCQNHGEEEKFRELYMERPEDLVGKVVRLEALEVERHLQEMDDCTCGSAYLDSKAYDPKEVWGFWNFGPFVDKEALCASPIFQREQNEAAFAIIDNVTDRFIGVVMLKDDDPQNLTITLEPPITKPSSEGTAEPIEACFLVMDKLFALGYRRIQMSIDSQDALNKKVCARLGFTKEALIPKHMVVKDSNRDSLIYSMLNSDWKGDKGAARSFLYRKLHGVKAQKKDDANNKKEHALDEQAQVLAARKAAEEEAGAEKKE